MSLKCKRKIGKMVCPDCGEYFYFRYVTHKVPSLECSYKQKVQIAFEQHKAKNCTQ